MVKKEMSHFTKDGILWHCWYEVSISEKGRKSFKIFGSEALCSCPDYELDRKTLEGISIH